MVKSNDIKVVSKSKNNRRAEIIVNGQTKHVRLEEGQWHWRQLGPDGQTLVHETYKVS